MARKDTNKEIAVSEKSVQRPTADYTPRLQATYSSKVRGALKDQFKYGNEMEVPRLQKIVVNMGLGEAVQNPKIIDVAVAELTAITGQKPIIRRARKSIAGFKLREGMPIGVKVTLRSCRMWEFADRLFSIALPRVRDFKGISPTGFDGQGNFTMGIKEHTVFPEIDYDNIDATRGMNICFVTSAKTNDEGRELLRSLGMPFRKKSEGRASR